MLCRSWVGGPRKYQERARMHGGCGSLRDALRFAEGLGFAGVCGRGLRFAEVGLRTVLFGCSEQLGYIGSRVSLGRSRGLRNAPRNEHHGATIHLVHG